MKHPPAPDVIFLVDDDPVARMLTAAVLEQQGFEVVQAGTGNAALAVFSTRRFDCVLLDALMPGMDGFEVCKSMRRLPNGANVPVLMLTGLDDEDSIAQAYEAGATDFLTLPFDLPALAARTTNLLALRQAQLQLRKRPWNTLDESGHPSCPPALLH